jgi:hypothetical protein
MSTHWKWAERVAAQHDREKPFAPENGRPLKFKPCDRVVYTNPQGVSFSLRVIGFYERSAEPDGMYASGARYLLDWECPWYPVAESCLRFPEPAVKPVAPSFVLTPRKVEHPTKP